MDVVQERLEREYDLNLITTAPSVIYRVDGVFRGVRIPAPGAYVVEYRYRPPKWSLSCGLAAVGFIGLGLLTLGRGRA